MLKALRPDIAVFSESGGSVCTAFALKREGGRGSTLHMPRNRPNKRGQVPRLDQAVQYGLLMEHLEPIYT